MFVNDNLICLIIQLVGPYLGGFLAKVWPGTSAKISAKTERERESENILMRLRLTDSALSRSQKDNLESKV